MNPSLPPPPGSASAADLPPPPSAGTTPPAPAGTPDTIAVPTLPPAGTTVHPPNGTPEPDPASPPVPDAPVATTGVALPTLPPVGTADGGPSEPTPRDVQLETEVAHGGLGAPEDSPASTPGRRRPLHLVLVAAVLVAAAAGGVLWFTGGGDTDPSPTTPADGNVTDEATTIGQIGVDAMNDAADVVDSINADDGETELLGELGLDPSGEPVAAAPDAGHQFTWTFPDGVAATVVVDATTGDHAYTDTTGLAFRQVGELAFARPTADARWAMVDATDLAAVQRLGLDRPIVVSDLVGGPVGDHATASGDGSLWVVDDPAFAADDPVGRDEWLARVGLIPGPPDGPVTVWVSTIADDDVVTSATVERAAAGQVVRYDLDRRFDEPPVIEAPDL